MSRFIYNFLLETQIKLLKFFNNNDDQKISNPTTNSDNYKIYGNYYGLNNQVNDYSAEPLDSLDRSAMIHDIELLNAKTTYDIFMTFNNLTYNILKTLRLEIKDDMSLFEKTKVILKKYTLKTILITNGIIGTCLIDKSIYNKPSEYAKYEYIMINQQTILNNEFLKYIES